MAERIALFPGSFDPITVGHVDIIRRSVDLFDRLVVAIGVNARKQSYFKLEQRKAWIQELFADDQRIEVASYEGLTVNFGKAIGATYIVRGIRSAADFEYEKVIAQVNRDVSEMDMETLLILSRPENAHISSTVVKEIILGKGHWGPFVPEVVQRDVAAGKS